jgi:NADP-dependent aldehyde dehydrogenase
MEKLTGRSLIGFRDGTVDDLPFYATNPATGAHLQPSFFPATPEETDLAARLAHDAFALYSRTTGEKKAVFLRIIADQIESVATEIVERAGLETALPQARLQGEIVRTCNQLRLFATLVQEGSWVGARIDLADPERKPFPKPDLRSMLRPLGPVVVFGASNFPLAFSVAGGDTASALAAGNPVIVKAHAAHPGTSELVGRAVRESVRECGLPEGVFSMLFCSGTRVGAALVKHPMVKAGGFTGSRSAGRTLMDIAAARLQPIPFYAEMSSTNPVFILPGALRERPDKIAAGLYASFTTGAGQFCTKPGIVFLAGGVDGTSCRNKLRELVQTSAEFKLLTANIHSSYHSAVAGRISDGTTTVAAQTTDPCLGEGFAAGPIVFETDSESYLKNPALEAEVFGPSTLLVQNVDPDRMREIARNLEGHLTATIHGNDRDLQDFAELISVLEQKVGRLIFNGFPTGVEVSHAMVHGGPYPSTSDGRSTSVGSQAIFRFARPVCYQGFPDHALPSELKDSNPLGIWRMVEGQMTRESPLIPCGGQ